VLSRGHNGPNSKPSSVSFQPSALVFPAAQVSKSVTRSFTLTNYGSSPATITRISITGPGRHDFSVLTPTLLAAVRRGDQAVRPAAPPQSCRRRIPHAQTCTITVAFTPLAPGPYTAELRINLASRPQPQDITLRGTGTVTSPPPSPVSVTSVSPPVGAAKGGTSVTITGTDFTAPPALTTVSFGGVAAEFTIDSGTQITATSPPGTGTVHITVTTPAGTSAATAASQYRYTQAATSTTTTVASSANPSMAGQPVTYTATVSPVPDGGTMAFSDNGSPITGCGAQPVDASNGTATCQVPTYTGAGRHVITATYSGHAAYGSSTDSLTEAISDAATSTTTTITSSANPSIAGYAVTYTATVSPLPDGGTVAFTDGGTPITGCGAQPVDTSTGMATCQVTYYGQGMHSITAAYSGDTAYTGSADSLTQSVNPPLQ
jgi:hypothetical protein